MTDRYSYPLYQVQITTKKNCYTFEVGEVGDYFTVEELALEYIKLNEEPELDNFSYYTVNAKCGIGRTNLPGVNRFTKTRELENE